MCEIGMRIPFQTYRYVTDHLHLYVTNSYIFVHTATLILLAVCLSLVNVNTTLNTTFTTIVVCHQISTGPMDLLLYIFCPILQKYSSNFVTLIIVLLLAGCSFVS